MDQRLYGDNTTYEQYTALDFSLQEAAVQVQLDVVADSDVTKVDALWADCMQASGFTARVPRQIGEGPWNEPRPGKLEIDTAKADVACKIETNLVAVYEKSLFEHFAEAEERNATSLAEFFPLRDMLLKNAAAALAE